MSSRWNTASVGLSLLIAGSFGAARAAEVQILRMDTREAMYAGSFEAVTLDSLGALGLAHRLVRLSSVEEPYVFAAAPVPGGVVIGTGNSGRILRVDEKGVEELFAAPQAEIFAIWADRKGTVFAGSSPQGSVWMIGEEAAIFDPPDLYIWALTEDKKGDLLIATGLDGRVYRVGRDRKGHLSGDPVVIETGDSHARAMAVLPSGDVLVGTAGRGLILKIDHQNAVETVYDAVQPEIAAFAVAPDGTAYAALLASEASLVDLSDQGEEANGDAAEDAGAVTIEAQDQTVFGSRTASFEGVRSMVIEISPGGSVRELFSFENETVYSLLWRAGELWIGTGLEGRLYRWRAESVVFERKLSELQIAALVANEDGVSVVTTNGAAAYRLEDSSAEVGTYTSSVFDAKNTSRFGSFRWWGRGDVEFSFRSGMSSEADRTWTEWVIAESSLAEIPLHSLSDGRYFQWRGRMRAGQRSEDPGIDYVELSYLQRNRRPSIGSFMALDAGQILVPSSFNASNNTFEPWSPNKEGIFTSLKAVPTNGDSGLKTLWKKGYRTLRWAADDPNGDSLVASLELRVDPGGEWLPMVSELEESHYSFDSSALPDGTYRFRLTVFDGDTTEEMEVRRISPPVVIDHAPPEMVEARTIESFIVVDLRDVSSPIRRAELSADAGAWKPVVADDGLLDGQRETVRLSTKIASRLLLLRVTDAAFNVVTFDLSKMLKN